MLYCNINILSFWKNIMWNGSENFFIWLTVAIIIGTIIYFIINNHNSSLNKKTSKSPIPVKYKKNNWIITAMYDIGFNPHDDIYDLAEIFELWKQWKSINVKNKYWRTALMTASDIWNEKMAEVLLNHWANINSKNEDWTALTHAVFRRKTNMVKLLLKYSPDIYIQDKQWRTALSLAEELVRDQNGIDVDNVHKNLSSAFSKSDIDDYLYNRIFGEREILRMILEYRDKKK